MWFSAEWSSSLCVSVFFWWGGGRHTKHRTLQNEGQAQQGGFV